MPQRRRPAQTEREWWALLKSKDKTVIRSMEDWRAALADPKTNPLQGCSPKAVQHFTKNLKFVNGGLGHADYTQIGRELNYFQFRDLWSRFGLGMDLFADHDGYYCESKGTCYVRTSSLCTSNC